MIKIQIFSVGKTKEDWLEQAIAEYRKRLQSLVAFEFIWCKDDKALESQVEKAGAAIGLDPAGQEFSSEAFATFVDRQIVAGGSQLAFVIGGAEGLPQGLKQKLQLVSLSRLTFTHQITRLILIEQIYRSLEILKGSKYHK
jgi:23S rRNA (pseudouridine1915-N3)-methyltransferase